jgi:myo-inositol 2-dehydrogenase / D-chiro-inositol 1-dehydrogenase
VTVHFPPRADIRIGIIGCGRAAATLHVPALRGLRGAAVVAVSDCDAERSRRLAVQCDGATSYPDYHDLLADQRVDLVAVCVPAALHAAVAVAAFTAHKHVFIEKPLALTLGDCDHLVDEARQGESRGVRSAVGFNLRSHRLVRQAWATIRSGRLGEVEMLRTLWTADWGGTSRPPWHAVREHGGGALIEIGTHLADLWRYLLASEVASIHALSRSVAVDDQTAVFEARMAGGALVSAAVSQRSVSHNTIEVFGERGSLRLSCYHADSLEISATGGPVRGAWRRIQPLLSKAARLPAALHAARSGGDFLASYLHQWERIIEALRSGAPMPASALDGREAVRIVLAALESSREGTVVSLATPPAIGVPV